VGVGIVSDIDLVLDAEVVEPLDQDHGAAERLDKRIRLLVGTINNSISKLYTLVEEVKSGQIHLALGFPSWTAYVADVFTVPVRLGREQRTELVEYLSGEGMSQRAIANVVGTSVGTVNNDLSQVFNSEHLPDPELAVDEHRPTTGLDGKLYPPKPSAPQPDVAPKPRRKPITDEAHAISLDLGRINKRLAKLVDDDRFGQNRDNIGCAIRPGVDHGLKILGRIDREINGPKGSATDKLSALVGVLQTCLEFAAGIDYSEVDPHHEVQHKAAILDVLDGIAVLVAPQQSVPTKSVAP
jgi:hypothetical protein